MEFNSFIFKPFEDPLSISEQDKVDEHRAWCWRDQLIINLQNYVLPLIMELILEL